MQLRSGKNTNKSTQTNEYKPKEIRIVDYKNNEFINKNGLLVANIDTIFNSYGRIYSNLLMYSTVMYLLDICDKIKGRENKIPISMLTMEVLNTPFGRQFTKEYDKFAGTVANKFIEFLNDSELSISNKHNFIDIYNDLVCTETMPGKPIDKISMNIPKYVPKLCQWCTGKH